MRVSILASPIALLGLLGCDPGPGSATYELNHYSEVGPGAPGAYAPAVPAAGAFAPRVGGSPQPTVPGAGVFQPDQGEQGGASCAAVCRAVRDQLIRGFGVRPEQIDCDVPPWRDATCEECVTFVRQRFDVVVEGDICRQR